MRVTTTSLVQAIITVVVVAILVVVVMTVAMAIVGNTQICDRQT